MKIMLLAILFSAISLVSCNQSPTQSIAMSDEIIPPGVKKDTATFGTGCFWCTEAVFQELKGVIKVKSGYSGGHKAHPTYEGASAGTTGHTECLQIVYDPGGISFYELLEVFWESHDPTTLNRQGNDV